MKKNIILAVLLLVVLATGSSCKKDSSKPASNFDLPSTPAPEGLTGDWANGFSSLTELYNVYTGEWVGNAWVSGKVFKIPADGKNAEFYYTVEAEYMQAATKAVGNIAFDEGSTGNEGSFVFYAGAAHYNGWGTTIVNRDATSEELSNDLTRRYYYKIDGKYLRIEPDRPVNSYSSSFEQIN